MTRRVGRWVLLIVGAVIVVYFGAAFALTAWPLPDFTSPADGSAETALAQGLSLEQVYPFEERHFETRDGERLYARHFPAEDPALTILIVHGMAGQSRQFNRTAGLLREATGAQVYALDLRGHGQSGGRDGDVDHIGQYEEDLADVVETLRTERPDAAVFLSGHSMGGGIAQRYAQKEDSPAVDGYLLYAPLLGQGAPTTRTVDPPEGGESWLKVDLPRVVGLIMLNVVGMTGLNDLPIAACHVTDAARVNQYSFRALAGAAPEDYVSGLAGIDAPLLLLVGSEDEAFEAEAYAPLVAAHVRVPAQVEVVPGVNHNAVHHDPRAVALAAEWVANLGHGRSNDDGTGSPSRERPVWTREGELWLPWQAGSGVVTGPFRRSPPGRAGARFVYREDTSHDHREESRARRRISLDTRGAGDMLGDSLR